MSTHRITTVKVVRSGWILGHNKRELMAGGMWFVTGIPGDSAKSLV